MHTSAAGITALGTQPSSWKKEPSAGPPGVTPRNPSAARSNVKPRTGPAMRTRSIGRTIADNWLEPIRHPARVAKPDKASRFQTKREASKYATAQNHRKADATAFSWRPHRPAARAGIIAAIMVRPMTATAALRSHN